MPQHNLDRKFTRVPLCAAATVLVLACNGMAFAEEGDSDLLPDQQFFRGIMRGLGLRNGAEEQIEYKQRPPLVVPPSRDLPPPVTTGSIAEHNPAWPADYDVRQKAAAKKVKAERKPVDWVAQDDVLRGNELAVGKTDQPATGKPVPSVETAPEMRPEQLGYTGGSFWKDIASTFSKDKPPETAKFVREPSRASLTDPPSGYRTPSPDQPYGIHITAEKGVAQAPEDRQTVGVER